MIATNRWYQGAVPPRRPRSKWRRYTVTTLLELADVLDIVVAELDAARVSLKEQFAIRVGLEEAVVNALVHGSGRGPRVARICYRLTRKNWLGEVVDRGNGFDVAKVIQDKPSKGLGIWLMRRYMSWIRYNARGNRLVLCKYLTPPATHLTRLVG
jgi:serine/threonine-protein kinase RsbW